MVREFLELCSGGGEVRRFWPVPSNSLGEGEIQLWWCFVIYFII